MKIQLQLRAATLMAVLVMAIGCELIEKPKEDGPKDFGPEVSFDRVKAAFGKATQGVTLEHLAVGQYIETVYIRRLENEEATTTLASLKADVSRKHETQPIYYLTITRQFRNNQGGFDEDITEDIIDLTEVQSSAQLQLHAHVASAQAQALAQARTHAQIQPAAKIERTTFHQLKEWNDVLPAPPRVRNRTGCGGLSPCEVPVRLIAFDMVNWMSDGSTVSIHFDLGFSTATPFIPFGQDFDQFSGSLFIDCRSTYIPISGRTVYVRDCNGLEDFQK